MHLIVKRSEARARGLLRYFTGKPCKHGHVAERLVSNGSCQECAYRCSAEYFKSDAGKLTAKRSRKKHHTQRLKDQEKWRVANRELARKLSSDWAKQNRNHFRDRYASDIQYRLATSLRRRLWAAIKNQVKTGSSVRDLGCSIEFLVGYIEGKFQPGMSWDNWGAWHLDHVKPLASFDLTNREQFLQACHYTNLQPLWAEDNQRKKSSWPLPSP